MRLKGLGILMVSGGTTGMAAYAFGCYRLHDSLAAFTARFMAQAEDMAWLPAAVAIGTGFGLLLYARLQRP